MAAYWQFGKNDMGESEGPKNAGITTFTTARIKAIVREIIQNSIDARDNEEEGPVEVDFLVEQLPTRDLDLAGLRGALAASLDSYAIDDDRYRKQFKRGMVMLDTAIKKGEITALTAKDRNTTGASDIRWQRDMWHGLTKSSGLSAKNAKDSGGSFGVGKHAPFTATDIRTVLYSTAYRETGPPFHLARRFTGKAIFVSHSIGEKNYRATGWLEGNNGPLKDGDVPEEFRLDSPGTSVTMLGFDATKAKDWAEEARESLVENFFHALTQGNLKVRIDDRVIEAGNVRETAQFMLEPVRSFVEVSGTAPKESKYIEGIGQVKLRIMVDESGKKPDKHLALVRDAGMMITDQVRDMRLTNSSQMLHMSRSWKGFTAIVECLSQGKRSLLREAEGPNHDKISPDNADDSERETVRDALRELGSWIRTSLEAYAKSPDPSESDNAVEVANLVPLEGDGSQTSSVPGEGSWEITEPLQQPTAPRGMRASGGQTRVTGQSVPGGRDERRQRGEKGKGKGKRKGAKRAPVQVAFHDVRRLPSTLQWPEHSADFTFERPMDAIQDVSLFAIGEDGKSAKVELERAFIGGRRLDVKKGTIRGIPPEYLKADRILIQFKALSPIVDKKLEIRFTE